MEPEVEVKINALRILAVSYFWVETAIATYIMKRQRTHVDMTVGSMPPILRGPPYNSDYDYEVYHLSAFGMKDRLRLRIKRKIFLSSLWTVVIVFDLIPKMWEFTIFDTVCDFTPAFLSTEMKQNICFGFCFAVFSTMILEWPSFIMERNFLHSFGLDATDHIYFIRNLLDDLLMDIMYRTIQAFILCLCIQIFDEHNGRIPTCIRYLLLGLLHAGGSLSLVIFKKISEDLDEQLVANLTEIEDKSWVTPIEKICVESGYNIKDVLIRKVGDAGPNACCFSFFGLYTKIALYSSLFECVKQCGICQKKFVKKSSRGRGLNPFELEGIVAHEVGHWHHGHHELRFVFYCILVGPIIFICGLILIKFKFLYDVFHLAPMMEEEKVTLPFLPGLFIVKFIVMKWFAAVASSLFNIKGYQDEAQADAYAAKMGRGSHAQLGLIKIAADNLQYTSSDPIYNTFYDTHPTLIQRIEAIEEEKGRRG